MDAAPTVAIVHAGTKQAVVAVACPLARVAAVEKLVAIGHITAAWHSAGHAIAVAIARLGPVAEGAVAAAGVARAGVAAVDGLVAERARATTRCGAGNADISCPARLDAVAEHAVIARRVRRAVEAGSLLLIAARAPGARCGAGLTVAAHAAFRAVAERAIRAVSVGCTGTARICRFVTRSGGSRARRCARAAHLIIAALAAAAEGVIITVAIDEAGHACSVRLGTN